VVSSIKSRVAGPVVFTLGWVRVPAI
jgi:hypothetical protein